ncbi:MAG: Nascent polypeptide-associated complex protein [Thermoplasmata archaeon]|nr:Nascent polypeptide-associated complex protein [Thermoplasmata archaeon]
MMPGGPRNERQMQMMMRRLGMTTEAIDGVEEVLIRTKDKEFHFHAPEVTVLIVQGVRTFQVAGNPTQRGRTRDAGSTGGSSAPPPPAAGPPEEDVALVMEQANVDRSEAVAALAATDGAPAEAILRILSKRGSA